MTADSLISSKLEPVPVLVSLNLSNQQSMESIYNSIITQLEKQGYKGIAVEIPLLKISSLENKFVDPENDIKESVSRLRDYKNKLYLKAIYEILELLATIINASAFQSIELPLGLKLEDAFADDLQPVIEERVQVLLETEEGKEKLKKELKILGVPYPTFSKSDDPELVKKTISKNISLSLVGLIFEQIANLIDAIFTALRIYELLQTGIPALSEIFKRAGLQGLSDAAGSKVSKNAFDDFKNLNVGDSEEPIEVKVEKPDSTLSTTLGLVGLIPKLLGNPFSIEEIYGLIENTAKIKFNKDDVTAQEMIEVAYQIDFPILGKPISWSNPINKSVDYPDRDLSKIISDIYIEISNILTFVIGIFIELISEILEFFQIPFSLITEVQVPIIVYSVEIETI